MCKRILKSQTNSEGGIPFFKIGTFGGTADSYISKELFEEYSHLYSYPKKGDILISAAGTIGRTVVFNGEPAYFQDSNIVWVANDESIVLNRFLYYYYQLKPWKVSTGGTISRLYNDKAFVIGDAIDATVSKRKTQEDYGEVYAYTYSQLVRTAEKRLFSLKEKLEEHYNRYNSEDYVKEILNEPEQLKMQEH